MHFVFWIFLIWATDTEISLKNCFWGPVEWVGDHFTGWGGSLQKQNSKINGLCFFIFFIWATDTEKSEQKTVFGDQLNGLGTSWLGGEGPFRSKIRKKMHLVFWIFWIWATVAEISVKNGFWGPVEWDGDQLTGWGGSSQKQNSKINGLCFFEFFDLSDRYWDFWKNSYWGPVEWVGDQLNGLGASWLVLPESKFENKWTKFFEFFDLSDRYWDFCKKQFLGTSWMGWGPVEWVGDQLTGPPRIKIRK